MVTRRIFRFAWWGIAIVIVSLAVTLSAARLLLPGMSEYRVQIEAVAQKVLQRPVQIGALDAAWHGLSPVLKLKQVTISDARFPGGSLSVDEVHVALDIVNSITQHQWITAGIRLIGIELSLETDVLHGAGQWPKGLDWLLLQESVSLEEVRLDWTDPGLFEAPQRFTDLSLQLLNDNRRHQLALQAGLPDTLGRSLKIAADLEGRGSDLRNWKGTLYLDTEALQLDALRHLLPGAPLIVSGTADLELWVGVRALRAEWGSGAFTLHHLHLENATPDAQAFSVDSLGSRFRWQAVDEHWQARLFGLELQREDAVVWPATDVQMTIDTGSALTVSGGVTLVVLEEVQAMLPLFPWVDIDAMAMVDRLQPHGLLRHAEFDFRLAEGAAPAFSARATIENLQVAANGGLPGVTGLSGQIEGNLQSGYLRLESSRAALSMPKVFSDTLDVARLAGVVHWERYADMFRIESQRLHLESGPLSLETRWQLDWPYAQSAPWLDMQVALDEFPLTDVAHYLPENVMPPKAVKWLKQAFRKGTVSDARMLLQGRLNQMPFDHGEGRFEARFNFRDTLLDYHPAWGRIDELDGSALFTGRSMEITGARGRIQDSPVKRVVARIADLKHPLLEIRGTAGGTLAGMLEYTATSPLGKQFGAIVRSVDSTGEANLHLELDIPLKPGLGKVRVDGDVVLDGNDLVPRSGAIGLNDIHGTLHFTGHGMSADGVQARVLGQPVQVAVYRQGKEGSSQTLVDINGRLKLVKYLHDKKSMLAPYLRGSTQWRALLRINNQQNPGSHAVELELSSDLQGVAADLPAPFAKTADEKRALKVSWVPGEEARYPFDIHYAGSADMRLLLAGNGRDLRKAHVQLGGGVLQLPEQDEIHVSGRVAELDLGRWIALFSAGAGKGGKVPPLSVDLAAENFYLAGMRVRNIQAQSKLPDPWYFHVQGEGASGWVRWIFADKGVPARVKANLEHLIVDSRAEDAPDQDASPVRPQSLPEMNLNIADLRWGQRDLGKISLIAKRIPQGLRFETLAMDSKAIVFNGYGAWLDTDDRQNTRFFATVNGGDLGELVKLLSTGKAVKGGALKGNLQLNWPGSPADFSLATLEADIRLSAKDGRLVSVDEGGAGKLLSLFSLNSLQRRLTLDFRDVFKEGFSFDKMEGHFVVMDGDAFTNNFTIEGSSATIEISGRTGLVARDYDQLVSVTPQVSSTLPLAGVIAGGPAVGAAVFLADKLVGDKFNRMTRVRYQVSGSWDDPVYTRLNNDNDDGAQVDDAEDESEP